MKLDLLGDGRVALITGAGSGLGRAAATLFGKAGYRLALLDLDGEAGGAVAEALASEGVEARFRAADVADPAAVEAAVAWAVETWGDLDFVFNSAGILGPAALVEDSGSEAFDRVLAVNLRGVANLLRESVRALKRLGGGGVLTVSSITAASGAAFYPAYSAAKAGVEALTRSTARNAGRFNIRVNCLRPGSIAGTGLGPERSAETRRREVMGLIQKIPVGRPASPEDVASFALFLASPLARHIHGAVLTVDGGEALGYQA